MNQCNYEFRIGARKGEMCNKNCRSDKCGLHTEKTLAKKQNYLLKRSNDPEYQEKFREYMKNKRSDPVYKAKEHVYRLERAGLPYETDPYYKHLMSVILFQKRGDEHIPINHKRIKDAWGSDRWKFNDICKKIDNIINGIGRR